MNIINDERFIEYIYATLASWGMHRMGPGSSKMEDYDKFKFSVDPYGQLPVFGPLPILYISVEL